jgi:polar amino acid transport system substrate-binding protein
MRYTRVLVVVATLASLVACSDSGNGGGATPSGGASSGTQAAVQPPAEVASAGALIFCSDLAFPPMESTDANSQPIGADIDVGDAIAQQMGVKAEFDQTGFDGIIAALLSKKCDAIISGMNETPERAQQISFVRYMRSGSVFLVPKGNPLGIHETMDVCGKTAGGQVGSTNYDIVVQLSKDCEAAGKPAIDAIAFKEDPLGVTALKTGRIDAYETDAAPGTYYVSQDPDLEIGVDNINPLYVAIGLRKDDPELQTALQQAVDNLYADGTMLSILQKWELDQYALPSS